MQRHIKACMEAEKIASFLTYGATAHINLPAVPSCAQIITGVVLAVEFGKYNTADLPSNVAIGVLVVICVFVSGFAWCVDLPSWACKLSASLKMQLKMERGETEQVRFLATGLGDRWDG